MPRARKTTKKTSRKSSVIPEAALSKAYESEISYETKVIITILFLLFIYPIGLIFMWAWMHSWPLWLKLLITLPFILGVLAFFGFLVLIGSVISHARIEQQMREQIQHDMSLSPTPIVSITQTQSY